MTELIAEVDRIQQAMWQLPTDFGGYATLELWGPVDLGPAGDDRAAGDASAGVPDGHTVADGPLDDPARIAERAYTSGLVIAAADQPSGGWHKAVRAHIRAHTIDAEYARRAADALATELIDLLTAELVTVRLNAIVEYRPSGWYAALWEDWLLVGRSRALVVHLGWDS